MMIYLLILNWHDDLCYECLTSLQRSVLNICVWPKDLLYFKVQ